MTRYCGYLPLLPNYTVHKTRTHNSCYTRIWYGQLNNCHKKRYTSLPKLDIMLDNFLSFNVELHYAKKKQQKSTDVKVFCN